MKKRMYIILALCMVFSLLFTACGTAKTASPSTISSDTAATGAQTTAEATTPAIAGKITFSCGRADLMDFFEKMEAAFETKFPDVDLEVEANAQFTSTAKVRLATGEAPDVFLFVGNDAIPADSLDKFLLPLDDLGYTKDTILYYDRPTHTLNGKHYGLTDGVAVSGILASKKTLQDAGITAYPKTLDELFADCEKLKAKGLPPFGSMLKSSWPLNEWIVVKSGYINGIMDDYQKAMIATNTPITADSPDGKTATFLRTMLNNGYFDKDLTSSDWDVLRKQMDKVGMLMVGNYGISALEGLTPEEIAFFPFPRDNSGIPASVNSPDWDVGISIHTKYPEASKAFVKFLLEESGFADAQGLVPSVISVKSSNPTLQGFIDQNPTYFENIVQDPEVEAEYNAIIQKGQINFASLYQEVLLNKDDNLQQIFDKYNKKWAEAKKALGK